MDDAELFMNKEELPMKARATKLRSTLINIMVRGVGPPPYFTGKNMPTLCVERVRNSSQTTSDPRQGDAQTLGLTIVQGS